MESRKSRRSLLFRLDSTYFGISVHHKIVCVDLKPMCVQHVLFFGAHKLWRGAEIRGIRFEKKNLKIRVASLKKTNSMNMEDPYVRSRNFATHFLWNF